MKGYLHCFHGSYTEEKSVWEGNGKQSCTRGLQQVDCYQREWGSLSVSLGFPETSDNIKNSASYYFRIGSLAESINSKSSQYQEGAGRGKIRINNTYMVFPHSHLHKWHIKEGNDHWREWKTEVRWEESTQHNPIETGAHVRSQVEILEKRKAEILYRFLFTEDYVLLRFFQVFFPKQGKISSMQILHF